MKAWLARIGAHFGRGARSLPTRVAFLITFVSAIFALVLFHDELRRGLVLYYQAAPLMQGVEGEPMGFPGLSLSYEGQPVENPLHYVASLRSLAILTALVGLDEFGPTRVVLPTGIRPVAAVVTSKKWCNRDLTLTCLDNAISMYLPGIEPQHPVDLQFLASASSCRPASLRPDIKCDAIGLRRLEVREIPSALDATQRQLICWKLSSSFLFVASAVLGLAALRALRNRG